MYLYKTVTYHDTTNVATVPVDNTTDNSDFVANRKASAIAVDSIEMAETTFSTELSYTDFKTKVTTYATWGSVKYITGPKSYQMFLVSTSPLT